ncbi:DUF1800 domain-containing protein [Labrys sp. (in: a-proteobacteria)]|uniref:DUF1800 domain-containing protein n=1 Tax=Labrys sp. (in: a-proteobacteria) TaxID=1917972 RepID=UPI0039E3EBAE
MGEAVVVEQDLDPARVVFNRFGLGPRPGDLARLGGDPRAALRAELAKPDIALIPVAADADRLPGSAAAIQAVMNENLQRKMERMTAPAAVQMDPEGKPAISAAPAPQGPMKPEPPVEARLLKAEAQARFAKAMAAEIGFVERLVAFWSNHFCVSAAKDNIVRAAAGAFEREAIRPFVLGRFADMLVAVEHHPAMLYYLDNQQSIGPGSRAGRNHNRGLNENLAREILELHTLGVGSGYSQADVTAFARILTGWMVAGREGRLGEPGSFVFNANTHEPGDQVFFGKTYPAGGMGQAEAVLNDIARHPATARHIATKIARHFIADDPPPQMVARLAETFAKTDGDLRAIAVALVNAPDAWSQPLAKMRSPLDFVLALRRGIGPGSEADPGQTLNWLAVLGAPLWQPPGPNGFSDLVDAQASPAGMAMRLDIASQAARQARTLAEPADLLEALIGPSVSAETRDAVIRAESRQQAVALLLMAPEFQRR